MQSNPHEQKIILNSIQTPDGTILISRHRHDFVSHTDANGLFYYIDGGNEYRRICDHPSAPCTDLAIYGDAPFEIIREHYCRGGRGKDGLQPLTWVPLKEMNDEWLEACIQYNLERNLGMSFANMMYVKEQDYRKENNITIIEE